jgi:SAM-dependent methyltransferase
MTLTELVYRSEAPLPWSEGEKIPWDDPEFSERMLNEHLSQDHDWASRRFHIVDAHVDWIHRELLSGCPARVLDLGCGPGLYASRLARLGHECVGIDFSPASISYAVQTARQEELRCTYLHQDIRYADYGGPYDLAMLIFGEFNTFRPADAENILCKACDALSDDGLLLLEPSPFEAIQGEGKGGGTWYSSPSGLFSDAPHICLEERLWDPGNYTATFRYFIIDAATGGVTRYASSSQAYTDKQLSALLSRCGFEEIRSLPSLPGSEGHWQDELYVVVARKKRDRSGNLGIR